MPPCHAMGTAKGSGALCQLYRYDSAVTLPCIIFLRAAS